MLPHTLPLITPHLRADLWVVYVRKLRVTLNRTGDTFGRHTDLGILRVLKILRS